MENASKRSPLLERTRANSIMMLNSACGNAAAVLDDVAQAMARSESGGEKQAVPEFLAGARSRVEGLASKLREPNSEKLVDQSIDFAARHPAAIASGAALLVGIATYAFAASARNMTAEQPTTAASNATANGNAA